MFVRNRTEFSPWLAKGYYARDRGELCVSVEVVFDVARDGLLTRAAPAERADTDPPDIRRRVKWHGTSMTAFARVSGPARPPHVTHVRLRAGARAVDVAVFGDRYWEHHGGRWFASAPAPFEQMVVGWDRAFGGVVEVPPHRTSDGLPHPGGALAFALNPNGRGFCLEHTPVPIDGTPLPNVEDPRALIASPADQPTPHGFAPCPDLVGLRAFPMKDGEPCDLPRLDAPHEPTPLRLLHHAPECLVFDEALAAGAPLALEVHGEAIATVVPACPVRTYLATGRERTALSASVRSVHLDAESRQLRVTWGAVAPYHPRRAPRFIDVEAA